MGNGSFVREVWSVSSPIYMTPLPDSGMAGMACLFDENGSFVRKVWFVCR